ncbi:hypothetical protein IAD21_01444 [Abditibacteriota bacterium]|nr:hypothetical protein IAD21_01444 [Abditibacteriota bacterium]
MNDPDWSDIFPARGSVSGKTFGAQPQIPVSLLGCPPAIRPLDTREKHFHTDLTEMERSRLYFSPPMHIYLSWPLAVTHAFLHPTHAVDIDVPITPVPSFTPTVEGVKTLNSQYSIPQTALLSVNFPKNPRVFTQNGPTINLLWSFCALHSRSHHAQD